MPDRGWNRYWTGAGRSGAYGSGGVSHPAIDAFWRDFLASVARPADSTRVLDLATGNGAMIEALVRAGISADDITCVDLSPAAIASVQERFPGVTGVVADVAALSLPAGRFDLVTTQFGVEYGGEAALAAAPTLVAPDGVLAMLLHASGSLISRESQANLEAIEALRATAFVELASRLFETGFAAVRGADRAPYDLAGAALSPAVRAVEAIIEANGAGVAGGTVARLYEDVARIHQGLPRYDPTEVSEWVDSMRTEIEQYADRMRSMLDAAIDEDRFRDYCAALSAQGFDITRAGALVAGDDDILAWVLLAKRSATAS